MDYTPQIEARELPPTLPSPQALANSGQNAAAYEPWFWEVEYLTHRYLERLPLEKVHERHAHLVNNLTRLATTDRAYIPSHAFQSAWYWYRKEHQTRLELHLRGADPSSDPNALPPASTANGRFPRNEPGDPKLLFRYAQKTHAEATRDSGIIRVAPATSYLDIENDAARADDEMVKTVFLSGARTRITDMRGNPMKVVGDVRIDHGGPEYFVTCFSNVWDVRLFDDFRGTTHCIVLRDVDAFAARLEAAGRGCFEGWYFHHNPTWYFDPHESSLDAYVSHATSKDFRFAYQEEYRFLWANHGGRPVDGPQFLKLGSLVDIVEVVERPTD